eukprot:gene2579-3194_t
MSTTTTTTTTTPTQVVKGTIPNNAVPLIENALSGVTVSSNYDSINNVYGIPLKSSSTTTIVPAWIPKISDTNQYVRVGGSLIKNIIGFTIAGRQNSDQWVKSFKLRYTVDGGKWIDLNELSDLEGNTDRNTPVSYLFNPPIQARTLEIRPTAWYSLIAMRLEVYSTPFSEEPNYEDSCY